MLDVFEQENLLARSCELGQRLVSQLQAMAALNPCMAEVRGLGAMVAVELCKNGDIHQPDADLTKRLCHEAGKRGLILLSCGTYGNVIRILVPLTASNAVVDEGLAIIQASLAAVQTA